MSWAAVLLLAAGAYVFKAVGLVVLGRRAVDGRVVAVAALLPAALLTALVMVNSFAGERRLVLDARAVGLVVAVVATWRRAPFVVTVVAAAAATAGVRALARGFLG
jgi:branched-subunit amino acid transport protein